MIGVIILWPLGKVAHPADTKNNEKTQCGLLLENRIPYYFKMSTFTGWIDDLYPICKNCERTNENRKV